MHGDPVGRIGPFFDLEVVDRSRRFLDFGRRLFLCGPFDLGCHHVFGPDDLGRGFTASGDVDRGDVDAGLPVVGNRHGDLGSLGEIRREVIDDALSQGDVWSAFCRWTLDDLQVHPFLVFDDRAERLCELRRQGTVGGDQVMWHSDPLVVLDQDTQSTGIDADLFHPGQTARNVLVVNRLGKLGVGQQHSGVVGGSMGD